MSLVNPFATATDLDVRRQPDEEPKRGLLARLRSGLKKTHARISGGLRTILTIGRKLDDDLVDEIEEQLYIADIGPRTVIRLCDDLRQAYRAGTIKEAQEVMPFLRERIKQDLRQWDVGLKLPEDSPAVILVAGVNGSGKTTSIGKM
ncbi:MAG: signal recognition particle receptor subunit alpha, partial [Candidatus Brocadiia bacterium]|nr:signal recognition particle receptor subunit alpha [Candidatus Brocadiia bacterium]